EHERTGTAFREVLFNYGIVEEEQLMWMMAQTLDTEYVDLKMIDFDRGFLNQFNPDILRTYEIIPIREEGATLVVAAGDPLNVNLIDELHQIFGRDVQIMVSRPEDIEEALDHFFPQDTVSSFDEVLSEMQQFEIGDLDNEGNANIEDIEQAANSTPVKRFVNVILHQAIKDQASDIHFEPFADEFKIRYRVDGVLYEMQPPPRSLAVPVISRVKVISNLNIAERRKPQDGRIEMRIAGKKIDMRVSTLPTQYGESVVLRVLDKSVVNLDLEALGLPDDIKQELRDIIVKPNGILLVTGPTGSGKTTTLYSCLREVNKVEDKILTCEDPVEYNIEGLMQVPVNEAIGMTFAKALKAFLRQDPDRIMVGEIRDLETAGIAVEASLTGHFVFSTLHTNDAPSAITRLADMGVEPFLITSTVEGVLAQRLVRRICKYCRTSYVITDEELEKLNLRREEVGDGIVYVGQGCPECNNTGYKGRVGIFELFKFSHKTKEMVLRKESATVIAAQAKAEGMRSLLEHGIEQIFAGNTTVEEVLRYTH
ncbi:MAG: type II/IV secretion system protein, partial [Lentisphaerae bacterium]